MDLISSYHPTPIWLTSTPELIILQVNDYCRKWKEVSVLPEAQEHMKDVFVLNAKALIYISNRIEETGMNFRSTYKTLKHILGGDDVFLKTFDSTKIEINMKSFREVLQHGKGLKNTICVLTKLMNLLQKS